MATLTTSSSPSSAIHHQHSQSHSNAYNGTNTSSTLSHHHHSASSPGMMHQQPAGVPSALLHEREREHNSDWLRGNHSHSHYGSSRHAVSGMHPPSHRGSIAPIAPGSSAKKMSMRKLRDSTQNCSPAVSAAVASTNAVAMTAASAVIAADNGSLPTSPVKRARLTSSSASARASFVRMSSIGSGGGGGGVGPMDGFGPALTVASRARRINFGLGFSPQKGVTPGMTPHSFARANAATPHMHDYDGSNTFRLPLQRMRQELLVFLDACSTPDLGGVCSTVVALQQETLTLFQKLLQLDNERTTSMNRNGDATSHAVSDAVLDATSPKHLSANATATISDGAVVSTVATTPAKIISTVAPLDGNLQTPLAESLLTPPSRYAATMPNPERPTPVHAVFATLQHLTEEHEGVHVGVGGATNATSTAQHMSLPPERGAARVALEHELELSCLDITQMAIPAPSFEVDADQVQWPSTHSPSKLQEQYGRSVQIGEVEAGLVPHMEGVRFNPTTKTYENFAALRTELPLHTDDQYMNVDENDENRPPNLSGHSWQLKAAKSSTAPRMVETHELSMTRQSFSVSSHNSAAAMAGGNVDGITSTLYRMEHEDYSHLMVGQPTSPRGGASTSVIPGSQPLTPRHNSGSKTNQFSNPLSPAVCGSPIKYNPLMLSPSPLQQKVEAVRSSPPHLSPAQRNVNVSPLANSNGDSLNKRGQVSHRHKRSVSAFSASQLPSLDEHISFSTVTASLLRDAPTFGSSVNQTRSPLTQSKLPNFIFRPTPHLLSRSPQSISHQISVLTPVQRVSDVREEQGTETEDAVSQHCRGSDVDLSAIGTAGTVLPGILSTANDSPSISKLRRGSKRKSQCSPDRSITPPSGGMDASALTNIVSVSDTGTSTSIPTSSAPYSYENMCALVQRLLRDREALLNVVQKRSLQRQELSVYVNHMRLRFMQRAFAVLKFHWSAFDHSHTNDRTKSGMSSILSTPSKWRALLSGASSSNLNIPSARRWFALSVDGLHFWWSKQPTMENPSAISVASIIDVSVGLVGVADSLIDAHDNHTSGSVTASIPSLSGSHTTPMYSLRSHMQSLFNGGMDPSTLSNAQLFDLRRSLYANAVNNLFAQKKKQSFDCSLRIVPLAKKQIIPQSIAAGHSITLPTIQANNDSHELDDSANIDTVLSDDISDCTGPSNEFFPSSLNAYHAIHWKVCFSTQSRSLELIMQTKSDLDVWIEFVQRILCMQQKMHS
jgi:hypothetical protein